MLSKTGSGLPSLGALAQMKPGKALDQKIEETAGVINKDIRVTNITVKPQDRVDFDDVKEFAERLKIANGVHTPILVLDLGHDLYELIAGERRTRASELNGWDTIPAKIFPQDTPRIIIRLYQVSENVDRKALTVQETAMGLARDIAEFGREQAAKLWTNPVGRQRSESWISKHLRWQKYLPITRSLFDDGLFDDIEAANKMHDVEVLSSITAQELADAMRAGQKIGRLTLDAQLSQLKTSEIARVENQSSEPYNPTKMQSPHSTASPFAQDDDASADDGAMSRLMASPFPVDAQSRIDIRLGQLVNAANTGVAATATLSPTLSALPSTRYRDGVAQNGKSGRSVQTGRTKSVVWHIEDLIEKYTSALHIMRLIQADLAQGSTGKDDIDWRLWVIFVGMTCSALVGVGSERADQMMSHLNQELKSKSAIEILNALHPTRKRGVLPDDFRFDTGRDLHPMRPPQWVL